jgi:hypothetical protein
MLIGATLLCAASAATAATQTGSVAVTGTMTNPAPPASCSVGAVYIDATYQIPYDNSLAYQYSKNFNLSVNCTTGTAYSVKPPAAQNIIPMDSQYIRAAINKAGKNIYNYPLTGTGTGSTQSIALTVFFTPLGLTTFDKTTVGTISGNFPLTITY